MNRYTKTKFGTEKDRGNSYTFCFNHRLTKLLNMTLVRKFEVMLGQTLKHSL
jgi:hypothetical protein